MLALARRKLAQVFIRHRTRRQTFISPAALRRLSHIQEGAGSPTSHQLTAREYKAATLKGAAAAISYFQHKLENKHRRSLLASSVSLLTTDR